MLESTPRLTVPAPFIRGLLLTLSVCLILMVIGQDQPANSQSGQRLEIGESLWNQGQYDSAFVYFQEAVSLAKKENDLQTLARAYTQTGIWYSYFSQLDAAETILDSAIELAGRVAPLDEGIFFARREKGNLALRTGDFEAAQKIHQDLAEDCLRVIPEADSMIGMAYDALAQTQATAGELEAALESADTARSYYLKWNNPQSPSLAYCENTIGIINMYLSRFDEATHSFESAINRLEQTVGPDHPNVIQIRTNLGVLYGEMGLFWESHGIHASNFPHLDQLPPLPHLNGLLNIGSSLLVLEDYSEALRYFEFAEAFLEAHPDLKASSEAYLINQKSVALQELGQSDKAMSLAVLAIDKLVEYQGEEAPDLVVDYVNLASLYLDAGQYKEAMMYARKSLELSRKKRGEETVRTAYAHSMMADIYAKMNQMDSAFMAYETAAVIQEGIGNVNAVIRQRISQADLLREQGHPDSAFFYHKKAWELSFEGIPFQKEAEESVLAFWRQPHLVDLLYSQGMTLVESTKSDEGRKAVSVINPYLMAMAVADSQQLYFRATESRGNLLRRNRDLFESAISVLLEGVENADGSERIPLAWSLAEKAKAYQLKDHLKRMEALNLAEVPDSVLRREQYLRQRIAFLNAQEAEDVDQEEKFDLTSDYRALMSSLEEDYPEYYQLRYQQDLPSADDLLDELSRWQALIYFFEGKEATYRFIFYDDEVTTNIITHNEEWESNIDRWRTFISTPPSESASPESLSAGVALCSSLLPKLPEKVEEVHIVPDGRLGALPFESLLRSRPENQEYNTWEFVGNELVLGYASSAALWFRNLEKETDYAEYVGLAPDFAGTLASAERSSLSPLTFNQQEVRETAELLEGRAYLENQATKEVILNLKEEYPVVHFATHAVADESNLKAKLYLSSDSTGDNGVLSMEELYGLQVESPLVVLSACQTAKGPVFGGEGVISLARAFRYSGARRVLASLWASDDEASYRLMSGFFQNLRKGRNTGEALFLSREEWMEDSPSYLSHPYYWANYVLIGNPDGIMLEVNRGLPWWEVFIGSMVLLFVFMWWWSRSGPQRPDPQQV